MRRVGSRGAGTGGKPNETNGAPSASFTRYLLPRPATPAGCLSRAALARWRRCAHNKLPPSHRDRWAHRHGRGMWLKPERNRHPTLKSSHRMTRMRTRTRSE